MCSFRIAVDRTLSAQGPGETNRFHQYCHLAEHGRVRQPLFPQRAARRGAGLHSDKLLHRQGRQQAHVLRRGGRQCVLCRTQTDGTSSGNRYDSQVPQYNEGAPAFQNTGSGDFEEIVGDDDLPFCEKGFSVDVFGRLRMMRSRGAILK